MRLGLALPQYDYAVAGQQRLPWATVAEYAARAEQLGFSSLWLADHLFLSLEKYGGSGEPSAGVEPLTTLGALAAGTTQGPPRPPRGLRPAAPPARPGQQPGRGAPVSGRGGGA